MGLPDDEFVSPATADARGLRCPICHEVFDDPVFCAGRPCQCVFCRSCLMDVLAANANPRCPLDRLEIRAADVVPHKFVRGAIEELEVFCLHRAKGCCWIGRLANRRGHEDDCLARALEELTVVVDVCGVENERLSANVAKLEASAESQYARIGELEHDAAEREQRLQALAEESSRYKALLAAAARPTQVEETLGIANNGTHRTAFIRSLESRIGQLETQNLQLQHQLNEFLNTGHRLCPSEQLRVFNMVHTGEGEGFLEPGHCYCLLEHRWYDAWRAWVAADSATHPGHIDNGFLLSRNSNGALIEGLCEKRDFILLSLPAWRLLQSWYGGGPMIRRRAVALPHGGVELDLFGVVLTVYWSSAIDAPFTVVESRSTLVEAFKSRLCEKLLLDPGDVRLWDFYNGRKYEELEGKEGATIEDCRLFDGNAILLEQKKSDGTWPEIDALEYPRLLQQAGKDPTKRKIKNKPLQPRRSEGPLICVAVSGACCS